MKIVLLSDWFLPRLGGVELQLRDLAGELVARGHRVDVVTTTPADPAVQGPLQTGALGVPEGVSVHRVDVPLVPGLHVTVSPRAGVAIKDVLAPIAPDVVHIHASIASTGALAGGWAAYTLGLPSVVTFHSVLGPWRHILRAFDLGTGWTQWPSVFSAVSSALAREIGSLVHGRAVEVLPNGLDPAAWVVDRIPHESPEESTDELRLVAVQRLQARKRGMALIRVVSEASERLRGRRRVRLTVIGDGPERGRMAALARRLGIADAVDFAGYLPRAEIRARFARSDAFVLVSVLESFGIAALEARAAGLPVVARSETGMAELLEHGREGLMATSDAGVVEQIVRLGTEPGLRARIAAHNRSVPPSVSWTSTIARHLELYERAISSRTPAAVPARSRAPAHASSRSAPPGP
ncbi:MAG: glycosyltransferase family 1 protein [Gemmatimonadetes bacterium]|nr:glycosyltransferase family 1 protein [Gemmatimonadota bacterium]